MKFLSAKGECKSMDNHGKILNYIYQNSEMGVGVIKRLLTVLEDEDFIEQLQEQYNEYIDINRTAKQLIDEKGVKVQSLGAFDKIKTYLMVNIQALSDNSPSSVAEKLIVGTNMSIIESTRKVKEYPDICPVCEILMERLQQTEQNNIEQLKKFL